MQGRDDRFTNASVEFNQQTLQPTYRLVWGTAGASHALSIAEGLKFDRNVIAEAHRIVEADGAAVQMGQNGKHAQAMQVISAQQRVLCPLSAAHNVQVWESSTESLLLSAVSIHGSHQMSNAVHISAKSLDSEFPARNHCLRLNRGALPGCRGLSRRIWQLCRTGLQGLQIPERSHKSASTSSSRKHRPSKRRSSLSR